MTERRGDPGFSVAPRRLGIGPPGRRPGRTRQLGVAIVAVAALAIVTIAFFGPRLSGKPNLDLSFFATPTPSATLNPTPSAQAPPSEPSRATPLPEVTRPEGATASGRIAIGADGIRVLDLADGTLEKGADMATGLDAIVRAPDGAGWTCVCFVDDVVGNEPVRIARIIGIDPDGRQTGSTDLITMPANFPEAGPAEPLTDVDIRADGLAGLLAIGSRAGADWRFAVAAIDIDGRRLGPTTELGLLKPPTPGPSPGLPGAPAWSLAPTPDPEPSLQSFVDGPHIRIAPNGALAFVWAVLQTSTPEGETATAVRAWRVALGADGAVGTVGAAPGLEDDLPAFCPYLGFAASDRIVWFCPRRSDEPSSGLPVTWELTAIDLDGRPAGRVQIPAPENSYFVEPLFDRANGQIYAWDPTRLVLSRLDVRSLVQESVTFDPAAQAAPGVSPGGGSDPPSWANAESASQLLSYGQQLAGSTGSRLYLLGFASSPLLPNAFSPRSLGIFVVDRSTLALVDRWAPATNYLSISVMANGQVLAVGGPGSDADGNEAPWEGSLTVHDPTGGRILVRFGRLGQGGPPLVFDP